MGKRRGSYRVLVGKPRPYARPRHRWEENIEQILKKLVSRLWTALIWLMTGMCNGRF